MMLYILYSIQWLKRVLNMRIHNPRWLTELDFYLQAMAEIQESLTNIFRCYTDGNMVPICLFHGGGKWSLV